MVYIVQGLGFLVKGTNAQRLGFSANGLYGLNLLAQVCNFRRAVVRDYNSTPPKVTPPKL